MSQNQPHRSESIWAEVEPYCILRRIFHNFWMVLLSAGLFALLGYISTVLVVTPRYSCSATFVVTPRNSSTIYQSSVSSITASTAEQFAKLLTGSTLINRVKRLGGEDVAGASVSASSVKGTNLVKLTAVGPSPRSAYYMCTGILDHYEDYSQFVFNSVMLETVSAPVVPDKTSFRATQKRVVTLTAVGGAVAMIILLAVLCIISGTIQTIQGARNQVDGTLMATLNHQRKRRTLKRLLRRRKSSLLISDPTTSFFYVETIHQLRSRLEHTHRHHDCKTFLITSVSENEGKSTVAANLALSLAKRHKKVLLVDCDLRKSAQHLIFEAAEKPVTLNALLKDELEPEKLVQALSYRKAENLFLLFASNVRRHSADLLDSDRMSRLIQILRENFEYVILDSSPMGFFTDSEILCEQADASILIVRQDVLTDRTINDAIDSLTRCSARFLGFVFNDVHTFNIAAGLIGGRRYGYGYGYGYGRSYGYGYSNSKRSQNGYGYGYASNKARQSLNSEKDEVSLTTERSSHRKEGQHGKQAK